MYHFTTCIANLLIGNTNIIHTFLRLNQHRGTRYAKKHNKPSIFCHNVDRTGVFMPDWLQAHRFIHSKTNLLQFCGLSVSSGFLMWFTCIKEVGIHSWLKISTKPGNGAQSVKLTTILLSHCQEYYNLWSMKLTNYGQCNSLLPITVRYNSQDGFQVYFGNAALWPTSMTISLGLLANLGTVSYS